VVDARVKRLPIPVAGTGVRCRRQSSRSVSAARACRNATWDARRNDAGERRTVPGRVQLPGATAVA